MQIRQRSKSKLLPGRHCQSTRGYSCSVFHAASDIRDEAGHAAVGWREASQLLGILKRRYDIPGITVERRQSKQGVAVVRMPGQVLLQYPDGPVELAGCVQRNRVYIGISRPV